MANTLTAHQATIIGMEAMAQLRRELTIIKRVNRNYEGDVAQYGKAVTVPFPGALSANDKTPGSDFTIQNATSTGVTVTLNKHKEATFIIEDIDKATSNGDILKMYMGSAMTAITEKVEDDLFTLYSGFSTADIGTGGTDVTAALIRTARLTLQNAKAPRADRTLVLSPKDINALMAADSQFLLAANQRGNDQTINEGIIGRYMGFDVMESTAVPTGGGSTFNLAFHKDAIGLVVRPLTTDIPANLGAVAAIVEDAESGLGLRVILSYNAMRGGVQCTVDLLYGFAELRDAFGVVVLG